MRYKSKPACNLVADALSSCAQEELLPKLRRAALAVAVLLLAAVSPACNNEETNFNGYPHSVRFPAEGGKKTIEGDADFTELVISDDNGASVTSQVHVNEKDSTITIMSASYQWLSISSHEASKCLELTAQPNPNSGKSRTLYIDAYFANARAVIKVVQN